MDTNITTATAENIGSLLLISTAFLLIDGVKCNMPVFGGNNELSYDVFLLLFEGHFRNVL
jgi:hypothetical protein